MLELHDWPNFFQVSTICILACVAGLERGGEFGYARERVGRAREKGKQPSSMVSGPNSLPLPFRTPATQANCIHAICSNIDDRQETERGCVTAVQFILFNFANYSPSIVMELKV